MSRFIVFSDGETFDITRDEATVLKRHLFIRWCDTCRHYYPMKGIDVEDIEMALAQMGPEITELRCALRETNETIAS